MENHSNESQDTKSMIDQIQQMINRYAELLAQRDIKLTVSRRYFEADVQSRHYSSDNVVNIIFNAFERAANEEKEKKYGGQKNRYHMIVLCVVPRKKYMVKREHCREYAFVVRKVTRPHRGEAPMEKMYGHEKVLRKIENKIKTISKRAQTRSAEQMCKDTWRDAFRYTLLPRYEYKEPILGKSRFFWEMVFLAVEIAAFVVLFALACLVAYALR